MKKLDDQLLNSVFIESGSQLTPSFVPFLEMDLGREFVLTAPLEQSMHLFIILVLDHEGSPEFTIEIGWSKSGRLPRGMRPSTCASADRAEFNFEEATLRLSSIYTRSDEWWSVAESPFKKGESGGVKIKTAMQDAFSKITKFGIPYLLSVAKFRRRNPH